MKTISVHNGDEAHRGHNIRQPSAVKKQIIEYDPESGKIIKGHIDPELSKNNEYLIDEKPRDAYNRIFGEALKEYNAKQNRPERQISDYFNHTLADKKKNPVYEVIIQVGDNKNTGIDAPTERTVIKEFIDEWKTRNPNLELIGAYIHADEPNGTLHAHLDYIPVATGYKKSLSKQTSITKALGQQGIDTNKETIREIIKQPDGIEKEVKTILTAQSRWQESEREALAEICNRHGIEVERKKQKMPHLSTPDYIAKQQALDKVDALLAEKKQVIETATAAAAELLAKKEQLNAELEPLKRINSKIADTKPDARPGIINKNEVVLSKSDYDNYEKIRSAYVASEKKRKAVNLRESEQDKREDKLDKREANVAEREVLEAKIDEIKATHVPKSDYDKVVFERDDYKTRWRDGWTLAAHLNAAIATLEKTPLIKAIHQFASKFAREKGGPGMQEEMLKKENSPALHSEIVKTLEAPSQAHRTTPTRSGDAR